MIRKVNFIGMGALGLLFAKPIADYSEAHPESGVKATFVMDAARLERHSSDVYTINGEEVHFGMTTPEKAAEEGPADLVIIGVKYPGLEAALDTAASSIGENTTIISLMNGIDSEEIIGARFGKEKVLYSVSQEMDAQRYGTDLKYTKHGQLYVGVPNGDAWTDAEKETLTAKLDEVCAFFDLTAFPYTREPEILYRQWSKFMLNVGCNQVCMVYNKGYGPCMVPGSEEFAMLTAVMREVCVIAQAKGIPVGEKEVNQYLNILRTLDPNALPSMGQDRVQKNKSEVDMFAGVVIRMGKELGFEMPANQFILKRVREIEAEY